MITIFDEVFEKKKKKIGISYKLFFINFQAKTANIQHVFNFKINFALRNLILIRPGVE